MSILPSSSATILLVAESRKRGQHPLASLFSQRFDLAVQVVTPEMLKPGQSGYEVVVVDMPSVRLKQVLDTLEAVQPGAMVLVLAAFGDYAAEAIGLSGGAHDVLIKPVTPAKLEASVRLLLRIRVLEQELAAAKAQRLG